MWILNLWDAPPNLRTPGQLDRSRGGLVIENGTVDELRKANGAFATMLKALWLPGGAGDRWGGFPWFSTIHGYPKMDGWSISWKKR